MEIPVTRRVGVGARVRMHDRPFFSFICWIKYGTGIGEEKQDAFNPNQPQIRMCRMLLSNFFESKDNWLIITVILFLEEQEILPPGNMIIKKGCEGL